MEVSRKEFKENFDRIFRKKKDSEVKKNKNTILPRKKWLHTEVEFKRLCASRLPNWMSEALKQHITKVWLAGPSSLYWTTGGYVRGCVKRCSPTAEETRFQPGWNYKEYPRERSPLVGFFLIYYLRLRPPVGLLIGSPLNFLANRTFALTLSLRFRWTGLFVTFSGSRT